MKTKKKATKRAAEKATKKKAAAIVKLKPKPMIDTDRAEAAAEVLQAVWLHEKHFNLESEIVLEGGQPVAHEDADGHLWITVKLHVPWLDVDSWLDGTHLDHPDNQDAEENA